MPQNGSYNGIITPRKSLYTHFYIFTSCYTFRARAALLHKQKQIDSYHRLKSLSSRRKLLLRRMGSTSCSLQEIGRFARYDLLLRAFSTTAADKARLLNEIDRLQRGDIKTASSRRKDVTEENKVLIEMHGAFTVLSKIVQLGKPVVRPALDLLGLALGRGSNDDEDDDDEDDGFDDEEREEMRLALEKQSSLFSTTKKSKYEKPPDIPDEPPDELIGRFGEILFIRKNI